MYHYFDTLTNTAGDSLAGYRVRLTDLDDDAVTIYADENETPIISVSGVANAAVTDADGNYSIFVEPGTYNLNFSDENDALVKTVRYVPMLSGPTGPTGPQGPVGSVNAAEKLTITTTEPATPETGTSQTLVEFTTPTNPTGQPAPAKVRFSATHNPYAANSQDGIGTHAAYTNKTVGFSVGATATYGKEVSTDAAASMIIEHGFLALSNRPGGGIVKGVEFHWQMVGADYGGYRPITGFAPWTGADAKYDSGLSMQAATIDFKDGDGNSTIAFSFRGPTSDPRVVSLGPKVELQHAGNNVAWLKQYNAASNAFLNLPYFNAQNHLQVNYASDGGVYDWTLNALGIYSAWARACGSVPNNARLHYLGSSGAATVTMYEADATASTVAINVLRNNHASGEARQKIETIGTGNAILQFSRTFAEANITWNGTTVAFDKTIKITPVAVSALPSASAAGAGAKAMVNDANSTTFASTVAGGGSNVVPVYSDGTNWKIG